MTAMRFGLWPNPSNSWDDVVALARRAEEAGWDGVWFADHFIVGTPAELVDVVGAYRDAGVDELIVPDFNLGPMPRKLDTFDRFMTEVASAHR